MPVTMEQVRKALDPDEPDYSKAATLGPGALPHLQTLVLGDDEMLASKAAYLAGLIRDEKSLRVIETATSSKSDLVRLAAAGTARNLAEPHASRVLLLLISDADSGVRMAVLESIGKRPTKELVEQVKRLSQNDPDREVRNLAAHVLLGLKRRVRRPVKN